MTLNFLYTAVKELSFLIENIKQGGLKGERSTIAAIQSTGKVSSEIEFFTVLIKKNEFTCNRCREG